MMKTFATILLIGATLVPARAQLFSRESIGGAALGGLVGGVIGHNSGRKTAEGAAIGAGAGLLLGAVAGQSRRDYYAGYGTPSFSGEYYVYEPQRPNYALTGAVLGGVAGGVIGHNGRRKTAEGIAIGAGAGLILGSLAEQNAARYVEAFSPAPGYAVVPAPSQIEAVPVPVPQPQTTVAPHRPVQNQTVATASPSPMRGANNLFGR